jgi:hypothetical protein
MNGPSYQERVGEWLLDRKAHYPEESMHEIADALPWFKFDKYIERDYRSSDITSKQYREELQKDPSKNARQMLRKLDGEEIGEDPYDA